MIFALIDDLVSIFSFVDSLPGGSLHEHSEEASYGMLSGLLNKVGLDSTPRVHKLLSIRVVLNGALELLSNQGP